MGPGDIVSVDHATMEAIWTAGGSETRALLAEGPDGFAIASFGNRTYRSEVPNLMLQDVPPPTMASKPSESAPKAPLREKSGLLHSSDLQQPDRKPPQFHTLLDPLRIVRPPFVLQPQVKTQSLVQRMKHQFNAIRLHW